MHQVSARFSLDTPASFLARCHRRLAENNFSAVAFDGLGFHDRRILRHDDPRWNSTPRSRACHGSAMIATGLRNNPTRYLFLSQCEDCVRGPANLE